MEHYNKHHNEIGTVFRKENAFVDKLQCVSCNQFEKQQFLLKCEHYLCTNCKEELDKAKKLKRCSKCTKYIEFAKGTADDLENKLQKFGVNTKSNITPAIDYVKPEMVLQMQQKINFLQNNLSGILEQRAKMDIEHSPLLLLKMDHKMQTKDSLQDVESELMDLRANFASIKSEIKKFNSNYKEDNLRVDANFEDFKNRIIMIENHINSTFNNLDSKSLNYAMTINMVNDTNLQNQLLIQTNQQSSYIEVPKAIDEQTLETISKVCKEELTINNEHCTRMMTDQNERFNKFESILSDLKNEIIDVKKQFKEKMTQDMEQINSLKTNFETLILKNENKLHICENKITTTDKKLEIFSKDVLNNVLCLKNELDGKVKQIDLLEENLKLANEKLMNQIKEENQNNKAGEDILTISEKLSAIQIKLNKQDQIIESLKNKLGDEHEKLTNIEEIFTQFENSLSELNSSVNNQNSENNEKRANLELWLIEFKSSINNRLTNTENQFEAIFEEASRCQARANEQYLINSKTEEKIETNEELFSDLCEQLDTQFNTVISQAEFYMTINEQDNKLTKIEDSLNLFQKEINDQSLIDSIILKLKKQLDSYSTGILMCVEKCAEHVQSISKLSEKIEKNDIEKAQANLNQLTKNLSYSNATIDLHPFHSLVYVWEIADITKRMNQQSFQCKSKWFPLPGYKFEACAQLDKHGCQFQFEYNRKNLKPTDYVFKVHPKITCLLKDLSSNGENKDVIRTIDCLKNRKMSFENFNFGRFISDADNSVYVRADKVVLEIHFETPSLVSKSFSSNGVLFDRIENYEAKKLMEVEELVLSLKSQYFYTKPEGYRVQALVFLNTNGIYKGKGMSVVVRFLTGEHDLMLSPFFAHKSTVIIFNQIDPTKHLIRSVEKDLHNELEYYIHIESQKVIESEGFIKNDSLFYKVVIEENPKKMIFC